MTVMRFLKNNRPISHLTSLVLIAVAMCGCEQAPDDPQKKTPEPRLSGAARRPVGDIKFEEQMRAFCAACHVMPQPQSFPKSAWKKEIKRGFDFYYEAGRSDLKLPPEEKVVAWFEKRAPHKLNIPTANSPGGPLVFRHEALEISDIKSELPPAISFLTEIRSAEADSRLAMSDMRSGIVHLMTNTSGNGYQSFNTNGNPCAVRLHHDLDGAETLLVADLGSFLPEDHNRGRLLSYSNFATNKIEVPTVILKDIGRVADFCVTDFNGDQKPDIAVAEFGWHSTGAVRLLTNTSETGELTQFKQTILDELPGAIQILAVDLNEDRRQDIVTIISQETEQVVAYINSGDHFERTTLYEAPDPSFGSSGITLVDIDGDGDQDVIYTNGDTFDSYMVKPFHGIRLLTNEGQLKFKHRRLAAMPGVHRALPADLDGDGDLDIAAVALLPQHTRATLPDGKQLASVLWLENQSGKFKTHVIATDTLNYATLWVADIDGDGDMDLVAGRLIEEDTSHTHVADIFRNTGKRDTEGN